MAYAKRGANPTAAGGTDEQAKTCEKDKSSFPELARAAQQQLYQYSAGGIVPKLRARANDQLRELGLDPPGK